MPIDVLCEASPVWSERLSITGQADSTMCSEEKRCTAVQVKAFVQLLTMLSHETKTKPANIELATLVLALPLVHKYDCTGMKNMIEDLAEWVHFHDDTLVYEEDYGKVLRGKWHVDWQLTVDKLSQSHIDYIIAGQELYGPEFLSLQMKRLLAILMTYNPQRMVKAKIGNAVLVRDVESGWKAQPRQLEVQAWRITSPTFICLFPLVQYKGSIARHG